MYKYGYKKNGPLGKTINEIAEACEAIISEATFAETKEKVKNKLLPQVLDNLAKVKAERRNAKKLGDKARTELKKLDKDSIGYPIGSAVLKDDIWQYRQKREEAEDKTKELVDKRDKLK